MHKHRSITSVTLLIALLLGMFSAPELTLAASRTTPFAVGETLDPGASGTPCGPTDTNCFPSINTLAPIGTSAGQTGVMKFMELLANGVNSIGFRAPDAITSDTLWTLPGADGSANQVLATDGNGILSWVNQSGAGGASIAGYFVATTTTATSTFAGGITGPGSFTLQQGSGNVGIGTTSPYAKLSVVGNVVADSFNATSTTGYQLGGVTVLSAPNANTFIGSGAGASTTSGNWNLFSGYHAGWVNTSGSSNVANGYQALASNTTGSENTANGNISLYSNTTGYSNVANGFRALYSNTTGFQNTATGYQSLYLNTTGNNNTANGYYALNSNTTGTLNSANGYQSLYSNTSGTGNVANGYQSLYFNTTGSSNVANGGLALFFNTGSYNTAQGGYSLFNNTTGASSTAIGYFSGGSNTTGSRNTFIGMNAGYTDGTTATLSNLTNATAIGYNAQVRQSNSLILGGTGAYGVNVGIGTTSPYARLSVVGNVVADSFNATSSVGYQLGGTTLLTASSTAGNMFVGLGSGTSMTNGARNTFLGYQSGQANTAGFDNTAGGYQALLSNTGGYYNTAYGSNALTVNTTGFNNTANGFQTLKANTTGFDNTAIGVNSLSFNTTGFENTAIGYNSLALNVTGVWNTANGSNALLQNTSGSANTANGQQALYQNTTGYSNTANGASALSSNTTGSNNTAVGYLALATNTVGSENTATGYMALRANTTGASSTAVGYQAGRANTTGNFNTFLGFNAGYTDGTTATLSNLTNATAIGYNAQVAQSNSLVLGGTGAYAVNVGIGTTSPYAKLSVAGDVVADSFNATSTTATSTFGPVRIGSDQGVMAGLSVTRNGTGTLYGTYGIISGNPTTGIGSYASAKGTNAYGFVSELNNISGITNGYGFRATSQVQGLGMTTAYGLSVDSFINAGSNYGVYIANQGTGASQYALYTAGGKSYFADNVGIGTTSPYAKLSIVGQTLSDSFNATSTTGYQLGGTTLLTASSTEFNTFVGLGAGASNTTGSSNTFTGYEAGGANTTGSNNSAFGSIALHNNTTGSSNSVFGSNSLTNNTSGGFNVAFGNNTLTSNLAGTSNVAIGPGSMFNNSIGNSNSTLGRQALFSVTSSANTAVGYQALYNQGIGASTTALGYAAGYTNGTGNNNLYIGDEADALAGTYSNSTAIGSHAKVGASNSLVLGGTGAWGVNVGIGTTSPYAKLSVAGDVVADSFNATSTTATSTFKNSVIIGSDQGVQAGLTVGKSGAGSVYGIYSLVSGTAPTQGVGVYSYPKGTTAVGFKSELNNGGGITNGYGLLATSAFNGLGVTTAYGVNIDSFSSATNAYGVYVGDQGSGTNKFAIYAAGSTDKSYFGGNVGIGTTSPYAKLSVAGSVVADSFNATSTTATSTFANNISIGSAASYRIGGSPVVADAGKTLGYSNTNVAGNGIAIGSSNNVSNIGSIAIGLANTSTGIASLAIGLSNTSSNITSIALGYQNNVSGLQSTAVGTNIINNVDNSLMLGPSDAAKVTILSSGNVGVGTSSPWAKLSVQNSYGSQAPLFDVATTTSSGFGTSSIFSIAPSGAVVIKSAISTPTISSPSLFAIASSTGASNMFSVTPSGLVNINRGDITNQESGSFRQSSLLVQSTRTAGTGFGGYYDTANRNISSNYTYSPTGDDSEYYTSNFSRTNFAGVGNSSAGSVSGGVNYVTKTNTGAAAEVNGQVNYISLGAVGTTTSVFGSQNMIYNSNTGPDTLGNAYGVSSSIDGIAAFPGVITNAYGFYSYIDTTNVTNAYGFYSNGTAKSYFGGSVGIGTTSPYAKLSVVGSVVADSFNATSTSATSTFTNLSTTGILTLPNLSNALSSGVYAIQMKSGETTATNDAYVFDTTATHTTGNLLNIKNNGTSRFALNGNGLLTMTPINAGIAQAITIGASGGGQTAKGITITSGTPGVVSKAVGIEMNITNAPNGGNDSTWLNLLGDPDGGITMTSTNTGLRGGIAKSFALVNGTMNSVTTGGSTNAKGVTMSSSAAGFGGTLYYGAITGTTTGTGKFLKFDAASSVEKFSVDLNGQGYFASNVGIGTSTPAKALQVIGDIRVGTSGTNGCIENFAGTALTGTCSSDERLKTDITPIGNVLSRLTQLVPSTFYWNDLAGTELHNSTTTENYGLIAQNVAQIFPEMVATTSTGYLGVNYSMLPILTLQGLQDVDFSLESIASSTASSTDATGAPSFATRFFTRLTTWLGDAANGIGDLIANRIHTKTLCVGDSTEGETCITKTELDRLMQGGAQVAGAGSTGIQTSPVSTPTDITATTTGTTTDTTAATTTSSTTSSSETIGATTSPEVISVPTPDASNASSTATSTQS